MSQSVDIFVEDVTRVEGHGNIRVRATDGTVEECLLEITESPRFYEAFLLGRRWKDVHHIACRICGICSVAHTIASLLATERAFGLQLTEQGMLLRRLIMDAEQMQSHILHVYFLAAPDLLGVGSVFPLVESHPDVVKRALRMKKFANKVCEVLAGRHVHPISMWPGGWRYCPKPAELKAIKEELEQVIIPDLDATVELIALLAEKFPRFERPCEYVALVDSERFPWFWGRLASSEAPSVGPADYQEIIHEKVVPHSTAKHVYNKQDSICVGARARVNLNFEALRPEAKAAAERLGYKAPCHNPFHNNTAQVIEAVDCAYDALEILDELLTRGVQYEEPEVTPRCGRGVGIAEAPRGTLIHDYTYDEKGQVAKVNQCVPTGLNVANIELDLKALTPQLMQQGMSQDEIRFWLEVLVRAYDPCISCSVHMLEVQFV